MLALGPEIRITATAVACSPVNPDDSAKMVSSMYSSSSSFSGIGVVSFFASTLVKDDADKEEKSGLDPFTVDCVLLDNTDRGFDAKIRGSGDLGRKLDRVRPWRKLAPARMHRLENPMAKLGDRRDDEEDDDSLHNQNRCSNETK